jgi:hypothetical protein
MESAEGDYYRSRLLWTCFKPSSCCTYEDQNICPSLLCGFTSFVLLSTYSHRRFFRSDGEGNTLKNLIEYPLFQYEHSYILNFFYFVCTKYTIFIVYYFLITKYTYIQSIILFSIFIVRWRGCEN